MAHREVAMADAPGEITLLLRKVRQGQTEAADELVRLVYQELRRIAAAYLRKERPGHTLQPTALINEAWLRLAGQTRIDWRDRTHFFGVAAQMMRRVLVDHARAHLAGKRGGGTAVLNLDMVEIEATPQKLEEILAIDEVLSTMQLRILSLHGRKMADGCTSRQIGRGGTRYGKRRPMGPGAPVRLPGMGGTSAGSRLTASFSTT